MSLGVILRTAKNVDALLVILKTRTTEMVHGIVRSAVNLNEGEQS